MSTLYRPPAPQPDTPLRSLVRVLRAGDGDLLSLVPIDAYRKPLTWLGYSRRSILLVNDSRLCREVLADADGVFPKNDLMVGALEGLVGDSIFVSSGERWRAQRRMIDPAFSQLRVRQAFAAMNAAVDTLQARFDARAESGEPFSLDLAMSELTADVICRTIFSEPLSASVAQDVFADFLVFERSVASVNLRELIIGKPWAKISQPPAVQAACRRIRRHIGDLLDRRLAPGAPVHDDIAHAVINACDPKTGQRFSREELIDQIGVFFLAGHETTASVLTWVFYMLAQQAPMAQRVRAQTEAVAGHDDISFDHIRQLALARNVFRETLRLYPPITFLPRVASRPTRVGTVHVKRGAMIMISPWTAHRNAALWRYADRFDPDRFDPDRVDPDRVDPDQVNPDRLVPDRLDPHRLDPDRDDADTDPHHEPADGVGNGSTASPQTAGHGSAGLLMSFGVGPRVCVGAAFATTEAVLIITRLMRRYRFTMISPESVRPVARLTTRPAEEIQCRVRRIGASTS